MERITEKNIVFIGFMGVGKTTIGQLVAQKLQREFIDIDEKIEQSFQMKIPEIFATFGEEVFRQKERELVLTYCHHSTQKVISLGGGAFLQKEIRQACLRTSTVILLDLPWDTWKNRYTMIHENRPLLKNRSMDEIKQLFESRKQAYSEHHLKIDVDGLNPSDAASRVIELLTSD